MASRSYLDQHEIIGVARGIDVLSTPLQWRMLMDQADGFLKASVNGGAYFPIMGAFGPSGTLQQAYDGGGAVGSGLGRSVLTMNGGAIVLTNSGANANNALEINKTPAGASAGSAIVISMSATATGAAVVFADGGGARTHIAGPSDQPLTLSSGEGTPSQILLRTTGVIDLKPESALKCQINSFGVDAGSGQFVLGNGFSAGDIGVARASAGIAKITNASTGYGSLQAQWPRRTFCVHKTPGTAATLTVVGGTPAHTLTGTASNVSDSTGHYVQLSGDATIAGVDIATTECVKTQIGPIFTAVIKTGALLPVQATERIWVGLSSASLAATDSPTGAHVAAFRYAIDSDGTLFWRTVTNDGGADTGSVTVTTAAIAASTRYVLTIDITDPTSITFYVNGVLVATHAANLPTTTQALGTQCFALDAGINTMEFLISKITFETN